MLKTALAIKSVNMQFNMQRTFLLLLLPVIGSMLSCREKFTSDASGIFEAVEIIVSAEQTGKLMQLRIHEGDTIAKNAVIGQIDVTNDLLRKAQIEASINALSQKTGDADQQVLFAKKQLDVQQAQLDQQLREKQRLENLVRDNAAAQKQLDDVNAAIEQTRRQLDVTNQQIKLYISNTNTQNRGVLSEKTPLEKSAAQVQNMIDKGKIVNPIQGTILTQYAYEGEMTAAGKALYKIADIDTLTLRAYVSGNQLSHLKLGQHVTALVDNGNGGFRNYNGTLYWISAKAEFTPKTIQTKDERANLVYAVKIAVPNDGFLKIGMYGEVKFTQP
jgi:HlyD family secretion protein